MLRRAVSASDRAVALDPNLILAAGQLITNRADRGELGSAYAEASVLVKQLPERASTHFVLSYVLRYAGLLDDAARHCESVVKLDRGNYQVRSCSWVFMQRDEPHGPVQFVRVEVRAESD